ncbi:hypothetical protein [Leptospira yasudae]|uniref:Uncharacterized protein n=1 Tax=Leptospira yasudae TaxID=2202201 RepID=A0A6N4QUC3_9LEPT|nr:hypothetical protein [Leptospira yasudae]TGL73787.1 hypothetical protein EHQ72_18070 [Leptospira yasudae]TGL79371.1 hypothetical protein EHQ77_09955 [Leptospira yasudae]TGL85288.1 hypothetical protein EHQ83_08225 [Leptospira yasudae]
MKILLTITNIILLVVALTLGYYLNASTKLSESIEYEKLNPSKTLTLLIFKQPKNVFGGFRYYFGAKLPKGDAPFVRKYSPILDSDKDKFEKIEDFTECGNDTYVITLKTAEALSYKKFTIFDLESKLVEEKDLKSCKRGRG